MVRQSGISTRYNRPISPLVLVVGLLAVVLGLPFGLYALLTREQRRTTHEIRKAASARGWRYRLRRWQGNPTAFRIDGRMQSGLGWILTSGNSGSYDRGWSVRLGLRFPSLGGEPDLAVLPRDSNGHGSALLGSAIMPEAESRVAAFSGLAARAVGFFRDAGELPSGVAAFDAAYQVLVLPRQIRQPPVDPTLADRILHWPADAVAPHSVLAWRDPYAFHVQARLARAAELGGRILLCCSRRGPYRARSSTRDVTAATWIRRPP